MPLLQLHQLTKKYNGVPAICNISLQLNKGQILCLLGPSGCGKTTLLRAIAGLEMPDSGQVIFDNQDISQVPPHRRDFGLMFQEFALFPHKNVQQNVGFGLQMKGNINADSRIQEMLVLVGLAGFERRDVSSLSGGERQRVALARSLAPNPRLLMLDEPLGALDRALRERLMLEIRQILNAVGVTAIYVTHDQSEAFAVADQIVVMNNGHIEQVNTPERLYHLPQTPFVARFLGFSNLFEASYTSEERLETPMGVWPVANRPPQTGPCVVLVRPEAAGLEPKKEFIEVEGVFSAALFRGRFYQIFITTDSGEQFTFEMALNEVPSQGTRFKVWLNPAKIQILPKNSPQSLIGNIP